MRGCFCLGGSVLLAATASACSARDGDTAGLIRQTLLILCLAWLVGLLMALVAHRIEPPPIYTAPKIALGCVLPPILLFNPSADCFAGSLMMTMLVGLGQAILFYGVVARFRYRQCNPTVEDADPDET